MRPLFETAMTEVYPLLLFVSNLPLDQPCAQFPTAIGALAWAIPPCPLRHTSTGSFVIHATMPFMNHLSGELRAGQNRLVTCEPLPPEPLARPAEALGTGQDGQDIQIKEQRP